MLPYQLKEKRKTTIYVRNSPRNTRSRKAAAAIYSTTDNKDPTSSEGTIELSTPVITQVSEMSASNHIPPPKSPDSNTKTSIEDLIGNLSAQFVTFDSTIKRIDDNITATRAEMNTNQTSINSQLQDMIGRNKVLEE